MPFRRGDVVLVNFPFTDLVSSKVRPAVVVAEKGSDVIIIGIFSKIPERIYESDFLIEDTAEIFRKNGAKENIRCPDG